MSQVSNRLMHLFEKARKENRIHEFFQLNTDTNRVEVALGRKEKKEGLNEQWSLTETSEPAAKKPRASSKDKKDKVAIKDKQTGGSPSEKKDMKELIPNWKNLRFMKVKIDGAVSQSNGIVRQLQSLEFSWIKNVPAFASLAQCLRQWEELTTAHPFWMSVHCTLNNAELRKVPGVTEDVMKSEFVERGRTVTQLANSLATHNAAVMQHIRVEKK